MAYCVYRTEKNASRQLRPGLTVGPFNTRRAIRRAIEHLAPSAPVSASYAAEEAEETARADVPNAVARKRRRRTL